MGIRELEKEGKVGNGKFVCILIFKYRKKVVMLLLFFWGFVV